jgi:stage II sporulation protein D
VLRYEGREIEAYYCSTCGGRTSAVDEVWSRAGRPYLRSRSDRGPHDVDWCADSPHYRWTTVWSAADLETSLAGTLPDFLDWLAASPQRTAWNGPPFVPARAGADPRRPGRLLDLDVEERTTSGRVAVLEIRTTAGTYRVRGDRTRWVLAPVEGRFSILRSAWFDLAIEHAADGSPRRVTADGRGFGHGIGLCQTGALGMARAGRSCAQILEHYYPGARLERLHDR